MKLRTGLSIFLLLLTIGWSLGQDLTNYSPEKISSSYNSRIALVIGNSVYEDVPLKNPANDAKAISSELERAGFEVITYTDLDRRGMRSAIREFGDKINETKGVGLFYYAGHGLQNQGVNYLVPIDADIQYEYEIEDMCVRADQVLRMMELFENPMNIIIIDACRNNPFAGRFRSMGDGLAVPQTAPVGTIVAFATSPGKTASDGVGDNGLYTQELIKAIRTPGLALEQLLKRVRVNVLRESNRKQSPWENSSLTGDFYFYPDDAEVEVAVIEDEDENAYYEIKEIKFYESDSYDNSKNYGASFEKSESRYINTEINFANKQFGKEDWKTNFKIKYYKTNGVLWTDLSPAKVVESDQQEGVASSGWGWSNPGYWQSGKYKVEVWEGENIIGEEYFSISSEFGKTYELVDLKLFESDTEVETKEYSETFDIYTSRYIFGELTLKNKDHNVRDWKTSISLRYYSPDGSFFGESTLSKTITSDQETAVVHRGFGYSDVGYWDAGRYTLEIWDGENKIGEKEFNMVDNRTSYSKNYTMQSVEFYEADENGDLADTKTEFISDSTRYIYTQINFCEFSVW